jgi:hypothetical protein
MGFRSLQHSRTRRSTSHGACRTPLRSVLRVWLPSRRLSPAGPLSALFRADGAHGIRPSELFPAGRYPPVSRSEGPTYRSTCRYSRLAETNWAGPTGRGSWALTLPEVPYDEAGFSTPAAGGSLGLRPSRVCERAPCTGFHPCSSHALPENWPGGRIPAAPRSINQCPSGLNRGTPQAGLAVETTLIGFVHLSDPDHESDEAPGLWVHLMPRRALLPTVRQSLGTQASLDRSCSGIV